MEVAVRLQLRLEINMMAPQPETLNQARQTVQLMVVVVVMMETMTGHKFMALASLLSQALNMATAVGCGFNVDINVGVGNSHSSKTKTWIKSNGKRKKRQGGAHTVKIDLSGSSRSNDD